MRSLLINAIVFAALIEGLGRMEFLTLLAVIGLGIAAIVCTDLLFTNLSSRAQ
jgi:hypothetical protein